MSFSLAMIMTFYLATSVCAETRYTDSNKIIMNLTFSSNGAECYAKITGATGTNSITNVTATLTSSNGVIVKSWTNLSSTTSTLILSKTAAAVSSGNTYILSVSGTVNRNGSSELVSDSITATY